MRSVLATAVAAGAIALSSLAMADPADDGPIVTAPDASSYGGSGPPPPPEAPPPAETPPPQMPAPEAPPPRQDVDPGPGAQAYAPRPPPDDAVAAGQGVAYATFAKKPPFMADSVGKEALAGAFSFIGAAATVNLEMSEGAKIVNGNGVQDPAPAIARALAEALADAHGAQVAEATVDGDGANPSDLAARSGGARYVVVVETRGWGLSFYGADWGHYHLAYEARMQVIDASTRQVVASGRCAHTVDPASERFTYDELTGNGAAVLKSQLDAITSECVARLKTDVLKV